jgi:ATP-dependent Clp protease ATP-binding subunit ClpA
VTLSLTDASHDFLLQKGFTHEYGAREMDRVIAHEVKPLLMREILFGGLQKGGKASLDVTEGKLHLIIEE